MSDIADTARERRAELIRWGACLAFVVGVHAGTALALLMNASAASDFEAGAVPVVMELPEPASEPTPRPPEEQVKPPEEKAEISLPVPEPPKQPQVVEEKEVPLIVEQATTPGAEVEQTKRTILGWQSMLVAHLERFKRYPSAAHSRGEQGIAKVAFTIDHEGHLLSSHIVQSSGSPTLDQETLAMLARAQPMPRPPENVVDSQLTFTVPVRFSIR